MSVPDPAHRTGRRRALAGWTTAVVAVPLVLASMAFASSRRPIEQDLAYRSEIALAQAGVPGASVQISGRNATVTVPGGPPAEDRARTAVADVDGVRTVVVIPRPAVTTSGPPAPPTENPGPVSAPFAVSARGRSIVINAVVGTDAERQAFVAAARARAHGRPVIDELRLQDDVRRPSTGAVVALVEAIASTTGSPSVEVTGSAATITGTVGTVAQRTKLVNAVRLALPGVTVNDRLTITAPGTPSDTADTLTAVLRRTPVLFRPDSARVSASASPAVEAIAAALRTTPGAKVSVVGHSASVNAPAAERQMGLVRARAVADALVKAGISRDRLVVSSVGATQPATTDPAGKARNRRVQVAVIGGTP